MNHTRRLPLLALAIAAAASVSAQPVTSPLGAMNRANEAVGAVDASRTEAAPAADPAAPAPAPSSTGLLPPEPAGEGGEGGEDIRGISYDPQGRRDPFRPLTGEAADTEARKKFEGTLKGRLLSEVKLTSILKHPAGNIATLEGGPKKEGYFARVGDELWDGKIVRIDADELLIVVRQDVDDPRSIKQWRDIVIPLWSEEEKKAEGATTP